MHQLKIMEGNTLLIHSIYFLSILFTLYSCNFSELVGFLSLKHLTKKVVSQNYQLTEPIDKIIFKQFQRVTEDTNLGLVSRILEVDEFVAVVNGTGRSIGIITHMQLLEFISDATKSVQAKNVNVTNGVPV